MKNESDELMLVTTKGYVVNILKRVSTPCTDVVVCDVQGEHKLFKVCSTNKGEYIAVKCDGEYLGRCYLI
nr:MAG TPA: hypothetical protein [Bacteriophage sp.]